MIKLDREFNDERPQSKETINLEGNEWLLGNDDAILSDCWTAIERRLKVLGWDENLIYNVCTAVNEAIINAMEHGNLELPSRHSLDEEGYKEKRMAALTGDLAKRRVQVNIVEISKQQTIFKIKDEGMGIPEGDVPDPTAKDNLSKRSGRGLFMINNLADKVEINGSEITMYFINKFNK